jgi:heptosyltransferase-2
MNKEFQTNCRHWLAYCPCKYQKKYNLHNCVNCNNFSQIEHLALIIEAGGLGAMLRVAAILEPLRKKYGNLKIIWLTRKDGLELLELIPSVDEVFENTPINIFYLSKIKFEVIINFESHREFCAIASAVNGNNKLGFLLGSDGNIIPANTGCYSLLRIQTNDYARKINTDSYVKILFDLAELEYAHHFRPIIELKQVDISWANDFLNNEGISDSNDLVIVNVGSSERWKAKRWPVEYFSDLCAKITLTYPNAFVLVTGGPEDKEPYEFVAKNINIENNERIRLSGRNLSIGQFVALIFISKLTITSCTFALQIAYALDKKAISFHGPQSKFEVENNFNITQLHLNICCSPCFVRTINDCTNSNKLECLQEITPDMVLRQADNHLMIKKG